MKFTTKQACENIVAKLTPNGETLSLSERSITEQLETLIKSGVVSDEMELDTFVEKFFPLFKTSNANVNNDVSNGIKKFKDEHPNTDKKNGDPKGNKQETGLEEKFRRLEEKFNLMVEKDSEREKKQKGIELKKQICHKVKELGVENEDWINSIAEKIDFKEDCDIDSESKSLVELYNKSVSYIDPDDSTPLNPTRGSGGQKRLREKINAVAEYTKSNFG